MGPASVQFVGAPCGQHGAYTFYKAFKYCKNGRPKILSLGEFFFLKISEDAPVCIGELQLLWNDKNNGQMLCSLRVYFLPEHTPDGRLEYHGEDEVLAETDKVVLKMEDLLDWITEDVCWPIGTPAFTDKDMVNSSDAASLAKAFAANNCGLALKDVKQEKKLIEGKGVEASAVTIVSFPQYCRYRTVLKRLENVTDKWLKNALVSAIGGFTVNKKNARVLFCRDTFEHPELQCHELRQDHLAPNLKGRPRKKRHRLRRDANLESDSNDSDPSPFRKEKSTWNGREKPTESRRKIIKTEKGGILEPGEEEFLRSLHDYMRRRHSPIERIPSLGFKQLDLYYFYKYAQKLGGYEQITQKRLWKHIYDQLGGNPGSTSAATCTRRHYERLLLPYERYQNGEEHKPLPVTNRAKKSQLLLKGRPQTDEGRPLTTSEEDADPHENHLQSGQGESRRVPAAKKRLKADPAFLAKEKKWDELRRQNALKRDKLRQLGVTSIRKTVKRELAMVAKRNLESDHIFSANQKQILVESTNHITEQCLDLSRPSKVKTEPSEGAHKTVFQGHALVDGPQDLTKKSSPNNVCQEKNSIQRPSMRPGIMAPLKNRKMGPRTVAGPAAVYTLPNMPHGMVPVNSGGRVFKGLPAVETKDLHAKSMTPSGVQQAHHNHQTSPKEVANHRPSVIQHTHQGPILSPYHAPHSLYGPAHSPYGSAHSSLAGAKRPYTYTQHPHYYGVRSPPGNFRPQAVGAQGASPYHETMKRPRLLAPNMQYSMYQGKSYTTHPRDANHMHSRSSDYYSDEQPTDLSIKKKPQDKNDSDDSGSKNAHISMDCEGPVDLVVSRNKQTGCSAEIAEQKSREVPSPAGSLGGARGSITQGLTNREFTPSPARSTPTADKVDRNNEVGEQRPQSGGHQKAAPAHNNAVILKKAESSQSLVIPEYKSHLHPAFPQHMFGPHHAIASGFVAPHLLPSSAFEAQIAYKDLMPANVFHHPRPFIIPPNQLYPHLYGDKAPKAAQK